MSMPPSIDPPKQGGLSAKAAVEYVVRLKAEKRYQRDVY